MCRHLAMAFRTLLILDIRGSNRVEFQYAVAARLFPNGMKKTRTPIGMRVSRGFEAAWDRQMVPIVGFELTTYRLQGGCSTPELNRRAIRF
jgi:hypothetical protein